MLCLYYGCQGEVSAPEEDRARGWELRDSNGYQQGQYLRHRFGKWSLIQWWDRTQGDKRCASNSTILLEGDRNAQQILAAGRVAFPQVFENLARAGIELVEVIPEAS